MARGFGHFKKAVSRKASQTHSDSSKSAESTTSSPRERPPQ
jgi:hypothetical protein